MFQLNHKVALVTGGGSGIGKEVCKVFSLQGAEVIVMDVNKEAANETVNEIITQGGKSTSIALDVTNQEQVIAAFQSISNIHILVNCAGISHIGNATNTSETDFDKVYQAVSYTHLTLPTKRIV